MIDNFKPVSRRAGSRRFITPTPRKEETPEKPEPAFKPPEEMAQDSEPELPDEPEMPKKKKRFSLKSLTQMHKLTKKQWIIVLGVLVLLAGGSVGAWYKFIRETSDNFGPTPAVAKKKEKPKPTTEASKLTGLEVALDVNKLPVTAVMIENSPDARPQSGLKDAGVVFEAVAEGGITRFLTLFQDTQPDYVGPVRSARPYYLDWALAFDAGYAHVGGSPEALGQIKALGVKDLDQFANSGSFTRVSNRYAPHNVYTGIGKLIELQRSKGFTTSTYTSFSRKKETPLPTPVARTVDLTISSFLYNVHYDWDQATNTYKRGMGGKPHNDERSGAQITPKVVVALVMAKGIHPDGQHTTYATTGSGQMFVFQDGGLTTGTWQKPDRKAQFTFTDANGKPLTLNPGQTWISVVGEAGSVKYAP